MLSRRAFAVSIIGLLGTIGPHAAFAESAAANDPAAIATAIYTRVAKGKGDGGGFVIVNAAAKAKYLSKALIDLWARADAHTQKGDVGPIEFDPVTNSQDPDVKSFKVAAEKTDADKAVIAVSIIGRRAPPKVAADQVVRYDFVREATGWKIDDIRGAIDGEPWSVRKLLEESLKY